MSNTNNVGVEVRGPTPMVFGFKLKPSGPAALLETPLVVKTTCFGLTSAVVEIFSGFVKQVREEYQA